MSRLKPPDAVHLAAGVAARQEAPAKRRILFVCIGNCIRSQFAEAFARAYGSDVIEASSCGLAPAGFIAAPVQRILSERGVRAQNQTSKSLMEAGPGPYDLIINISGEPLPRHFPAPMREKRAREWAVPDPMGMKEEAYAEAARDIEARVMALVLELRRG